MTERIERRLPEILTDISIPQVPDYFDDILGLTARRRQRPGWTFPGRWLPMDIAAPQVGVGRTPWRAIGIVVLLILAVAATVAYLGSRVTRLAPFFGPAANGSLIYERAGDIYVADNQLREEHVLVGGDARDIGMRWSLDGGTVYFGRIFNGRTIVMAANADGSNERQLTTALPHENAGVEVSPDGIRLVAINLESSVPSLEVIPLDGSNTKSVLNLDGVVPTAVVNWRPPDGQEIVFLGNHGGLTTELGLYRIRADGSGLTQIATSPVVEIVPPTLVPFQGVVLSDDGRQAAYWNWEPGVHTGQNCRIHLLDLDTGEDQRMTYDPASECEHWPAYLADGRLILESSDADGFTRLVVAPVGGGKVSRVPGLEMPTSLGGFGLAPDRQTMVWYAWDAKDGPDRLIDIETGSVRNGLVHLTDGFSWQRRAP